MTFQRFAIPALAALALASIAALIAIPAMDLAAPGRVLEWHIGQQSYRDGVIEAFVLFGLLLLAAFAPRRAPGLALGAAAVAVYLRRHHVDAPALAALVYFEALFACGALALRALSAPRDDIDDRIVQFVAGLATIALVLLAVSLAGYGRPRDLLVAGFLLSIASLAAARRVPATFDAIRAGARLDGPARALAVALFTWVLVLLARTNHTVGYDALWYGFRPEFVLAPERSLFDETGLVAPVFYFPKLYELVVMPLSGANDFSFALAFGVLLLGFAAFAAHAFARRFGASPAFALAAAALVATLPAIANQALAPKPDLLAGVLVVVAASCFHRGIVTRDAGALLIGAAAGALAIQAKLVAIPYVGTLVLATLALVLALRVRGDRASWRPPGRAAWGVFVLSLVVTLVLTARTFVLTGVPTIGPDVLMRLWTALGFELKDPVTTLDWTRPQDPGEVPRLVLDMLLFPTRLPHIVITWTGNAWLWLAGFALVSTLVLRRRARVDVGALALVAPVLAVGMVLALGVAYHYRGGDGNYLIAPLALGSIATVAVAASVLRGVVPLERLAFSGVVAASLFHMLFSFANASWSMPGTRALDADFARSPIDTRTMRRDALVAAGLAEFEEYLRRAPRALRVIGYAAPEEQAHWLSARYESLETLNYLRPDLVYDAAGFGRLLRVAKIDVVLLPKEYDPRLHSSAVFAHMADLERAGAVAVHDFGAYRAFRFPPTVTG